MAPTAQAASSARIIKLDASQSLVKSEKPKKAGKSQAAGDKQKKRKAGQQASSDDESEEEIVSVLDDNAAYKDAHCTFRTS